MVYKLFLKVFLPRGTRCPSVSSVEEGGMCVDRYCHLLHMQ